MRRPKYGWGDGALRAGALGLAMLAISAVERMRQDLRADRSAALRGDQP